MAKMASNFFRTTGNFAMAKRVSDRVYDFCEAQILPSVIEGSGMTHKSFWILHTAADVGTHPRSMEVADLLGYDRSVVSRAVNQLVQRGLVSKKNLRGNLRSFGIKPTKKGMVYVERFNALADDVFHAFEKDFGSSLTFHDKLLLRGLLSRVDTYTLQLANYSPSESNRQFIKDIIKIA